LRTCFIKVHNLSFILAGIVVIATVVIATVVIATFIAIVVIAQKSIVITAHNILIF